MEARLAATMTDPVLFRKLYTKILARQVHAEGRLHRLLLVPSGTDGTFDDYIVKLKRKIEEDREIVQKLGAHLAVLDKKENITTKGYGSQVSPAPQRKSTEEPSHTKNVVPKFNSLAALLNKTGLSKEFGIAEEEFPQNSEKNANSFVSPRNSEVPKQVETDFVESRAAEKEIDLKDINVVLDSPSRQSEAKQEGPADVFPKNELPSRAIIYNTKNRTVFTHPEKKVPAHFLMNASPSHREPWRKRVSFNDIPFVIAAPKAVESWNSDRRNEEMLWISDGDATQLNNVSNQHALHRGYRAATFVEGPHGVVPQRRFRDARDHQEQQRYLAHRNHDNRPQMVQPSYPHEIIQKSLDPRSGHDHADVAHKVHHHGSRPSNGRQARRLGSNHDVSDSSEMDEDDWWPHGNTSFREGRAQGTFVDHNRHRAAHHNARRASDHLPRGRSARPTRHRSHRQSRHVNAMSIDEDDNSGKERRSSFLLNTQISSDLLTDSDPGKGTEVPLGRMTSTLVTSNGHALKAAENLGKNNEPEKTTTAKLLNEKIEATEHPSRFAEWLELHNKDDSSVREMAIDENNNLYQEIVDTRRDSGFITGDALMAMRRQSWMVQGTGDNARRNNKRTLVRISSLFRRNNVMCGKSPAETFVIIKGSKKDFNVNKKLRRKMSIRPLPDTPDPDNEANTSFKSAVSFDTITEI